MNRLYPAVGALFVILFSQASGQVSDSKLSSIQNHLIQNSSEYSIKKSDVKELEITDQHTDDLQTSFVYIRQKIDNKPLFNGLASVALKGDTVVSVASTLKANIHFRSAGQNFSTDHLIALSKLFDYQGHASTSFSLIPGGNKGAWEYKASNFVDGSILLEEGFLATDSNIISSYRVMWHSVEGMHLYHAYINAQSGDILEVKDLVLSCEFEHTKDGHAHTASPERLAQPQPDIQKANKTMATESYQVFAWPVESPNHGNQSIVVSPADNDASPFGWHDVNGSNGAEYTITRGNNVWARDDRDRNNSGGISPDGGSDLVFEAPHDKAVSAELQLEAATINLFYWNNLMHDVFYHYGFDEAAGNFQENNYGNGGLGSDFVFADAQDGSGTNNANFSPDPEGSNPRMQMFLWSNGVAVGEELLVKSPTSIAGRYGISQSGFSTGRLSNQPIEGKLVLVDDGSGNPTLACQSLKNNAQLAGNIAVIDRGSCNFDDKILRAQNAGSIAAIVINNVGGNSFVMGGDANNITIPAVMISQSDGALLKNAMLSGNVDVSLYDSSIGSVFYFDSDFDNGIIAHEYTHGISTRLTGGASNSTCLMNTEQMGEGWSDFLSLVMTHEANDQGSDRRGIGTYVRDQATNGGGIRPYPYSTNMFINPVTYDFIKSPQFTVPHGVGSVWCSMLWDLYWSFIDVYGYDSDIYKGTGGNNMAMHLVLDGLKLQPCGPGFIDGRDAILKADSIRYKGANQALIWQVFAKRGLGYSADQGSSDSRSDGVQAFDLPPSLGSFLVSKSGPTEGNNGDTLKYSIKVVNSGEEVLNTVELEDSLKGAAKFLKSDGRCAISFNGSQFSLQFNDVNPGDSVECGYTVLVDTSAGGVIKFYDDFETDTVVWQETTLTGGGSWFRSTAKSNSGSFSYFINNSGSASDRTLSRSFDLTKLSQPVLTFSHYYKTEDGWDGAVLEILEQGAWIDLGSRMFVNGYNQRIQNNPASNISGRPAFTGNSEQFVETAINLKDYAGNVVDIRWRFVTDALQGEEGWYVDDVRLWNDYDVLENTVSVTADGLKAQRFSVYTQLYRQEIAEDTNVVIVIDVDERLRIYPNPFDQQIKVDFESKVQRSLALKLFDITGKELWNGNIESGDQEIIPTQGLTSGMYVLEIIDGDRVKYVKLLK